jgi:hypothetical protein
VQRRQHPNRRNGAQRQTERRCSRKHGSLFRNPMIPAAVVMVWENLNPFLPTVLKKISVIFYLKNLCPVEIPIPPPFNVMVIDADPTPFWIAVPGLLALSLILLGKLLFFPS